MNELGVDLADGNYVANKGLKCFLQNCFKNPSKSWHKYAHGYAPVSFPSKAGLSLQQMTMMGHPSPPPTKKN